MERPGSRSIAILMLITGVGTAVYWLLVALGLLGEPTALEWVRKFPYTSPVADVVMMVACVAYYASWRKGDPIGLIWGIAGATTMVYAALIAFSFLVAHWPTEFTAGHAVEVVVPGYLLVGGTIYFLSIGGAWKQRLRSWAP